MESENKTTLSTRMYAILSSGANMTKLGVLPGGKILLGLGIVVGGGGTIAPLAADLR